MIINNTKADHIHPSWRLTFIAFKALGDKFLPQVSLTFFFCLPGLIKTMFTQYVVEEPAVTTSVVNTAAMTSVHNANKEQWLQSQTTSRPAVTFNGMETDLWSSMKRKFAFFIELHLIQTHCVLCLKISMVLSCALHCNLLFLKKYIYIYFNKLYFFYDVV